jgi:monoamine oxidase
MKYSIKVLYNRKLPAPAGDGAAAYRVKGAEARQNHLATYMAESCDVCIIGAGASGLAAARRLADEHPELRVVVLEARERLGGRTATVRGTSSGLQPGPWLSDGATDASSHAHHPVEIGAEFIHGERGRTAASTWALLDRYGMRANAGGNHCVERQSMWVSRGGRLQQLMGQDKSACAVVQSALLDSVWNLEARAAQWLAEHPDVDPDTTSAAHLIPSAGKNCLTEEDEQLLRNAATEYYGADLEDVSLASLVVEHDISVANGSGYGGGGDGGSRRANETSHVEEQLQFRIDLGYSELWRRLIADGPLDARLGHAVTSVARNKDGGNICVTTVAHQTFTARRVIVTVPLALLQEEKIAFEPALSASKQKAIKSLGSGQVAKVILTFSRVFWPKDFTFIWTARPSQVIWRPGEGHDGEFAEHSTILTAFFGGQDCKTAAGMTEAHVVDSVLSDLAHIFQRSKDDLRANLVHGTFVNWTNDPWSRMGYSYDPMESAGMRPRLAAPEWDGTLLFAGEATSEAQYASVHGAIEEGERAAGEAVMA